MTPIENGNRMAQSTLADDSYTKILTKKYACRANQINRNLVDAIKSFAGTQQMSDVWTHEVMFEKK